jgi:hypothetical protein
MEVSAIPNITGADQHRIAMRWQEGRQQRQWRLLC